MSPSDRSNKAVFNAIKAASRQITIRKIAQASTYSIPTVLRAIAWLERNGYITIDRSDRNGHRQKPHHYAILREMESTDKK